MDSQNISKEWLHGFNLLNELQKRRFAAIKAKELGYGGISIVNRATGLSRTTITQGHKEITAKKPKSLSNKQRRSGSGRKRLAVDLKLIAALNNILEETSAGDPMSALKWTCKSTRNISELLTKKGFAISNMTVMSLLKQQGYSLQSNKKMLSGQDHPDRDTQFKYINKLAKEFSTKNYPVISVDTKKRELIGKFKNNGKVWTKDEVKVFDHDFPSDGQGVAIPYGTYDINRNEGFVNVGISSDTAEFAVNSIWQWWRFFGRKYYNNAEKILICADGGGSNSAKTKAWKFYLQDLANKIGLAITVAHYPPGTSKWNKIEHKMFSFISMNWQGRPLENYETVVNLISSTSTKSGLRIKAILDKKQYQKGVKISEQEFSRVQLKFHDKFPNWNYTIHPFK